MEQLIKLDERWREILDGIESGMPFEIIDLTRSKLNYNIHLFTETLVTSNSQEKFEEYVSSFQGKVSYLDNINKIIWQEYKFRHSRFLSKLCNLYGFLYAKRGSCGYNGCIVGGAYVQLYIGSLEQILSIAMSNDDLKLHHSLYSDE